MVPFFASPNRIAQFVACLLSTAALGVPAHGFVVFSVGGTAAPSSIQPTVDTFRAALGDPINGNSAGPLPGGRREINWDGGGVLVATSNGSPLTTFQNSRGATFTTPGTGFLQTPLDATELTSIQASYQTTFSTFSAARVFTPLGSNITDVTFSLPGSGGAVAATVAGFGAVFSDVDVAGMTTLEVFAPDGSSDVFNVPQGSVGAAATTTLSFLGVLANAGERIARVRIKTGNQPLGPVDSNGDPVDVVVMDDFLYSEPVAIPEPASAMLVALAILGTGALMCRHVLHA